MDSLYIYGPQKNKNDKGSYVYWQFPGTLSNGDAITYNEASIISRLQLNIDQNNLDLDISEVFQVYGEPDYVLPLRYHLTYQVDLIYEKGLGLDLFVPDDHGKIAISPDSKVHSIMFFSNGLNGYKNIYGSFDIDYPISLKAWNGYTKYNYP